MHDCMCCNGTGVIDYDGIKEQCKECNGDGEVDYCQCHAQCICECICLEVE